MANFKNNVLTQIQHNAPLGYAQTRQGQKEEEELAEARRRYSSRCGSNTTGNLSQPEGTSSNFSKISAKSSSKTVATAVHRAGHKFYLMQLVPVNWRATQILSESQTVMFVSMSCIRVTQLCMRRKLI